MYEEVFYSKFLSANRWRWIMYTYKICVMARQVGLYYKTFSSKHEVLEFLTELRDHTVPKRNELT